MVSSSCPECGGQLPQHSKRCSCGWLKSENRAVAIVDHRCWYSCAGKRCPLSGTMSSHTSGSRWYCRRHYRTLNDPRLAEIEFRYIEENFKKIMHEEYQDWRKEF
jgi:ribosomal protein S27AE